MTFFKNKKPTLGVWISDHTIEVALVADVKGGAMLVSHARTAIKKGVVERGRVKRPRDLVDAFEGLLDKAEPESIKINEVNVVFGLQNCVSKTHVFTLPPHRRNQTAQLVDQEIGRIVSIPVDSLAYDYRVTDESEGVNVTAVTTHSEILDEWQSFFSSIDIVLEEITVESMAQFRALFANEPETATCLVDLGQQETAVAIYTHHKLRYHYVLPFGGDSLTKAYAKSLKLTPTKAEAHKIKVGIGCGDDKEHEIAVEELEPVVKEIKNALQLYKKIEGESPTEVVLVGGSAFLKGLVEYLNDQLDVEVRVGQSVFAAQLKPQKLPGSTSRTAGIRGATEQEVYLQAIGFALMGVDPYWSDMHPSFVLTDTGAPERKHKGTMGILGWSFLLIVLALGVSAGWVYWQEKELLVKPVAVELESSIPEETEVSNDDSQVNDEGLDEDAQTDIVEEPAEEVEPIYEIPAGKPRVEVQSTSIGYLNARSAPTTSSEVVAELLEGEVYEFIEEDQYGWVHIRLDESRTAWVSGLYVVKQ
jgi:Tfp pilus assembly PilM family ATPase